MLWPSVMERVLTAEASRMGVLWVSVIEGVLTARRFFGLESLWVSFIRGVLTAEASKIRLLWVRDTVWSKA